MAIQVERRSASTYCNIGPLATFLKSLFVPMHSRCEDSTIQGITEHGPASCYETRSGKLSRLGDREFERRGLAKFEHLGEHVFALDQQSVGCAHDHFNDVGSHQGLGL